MENLRPSPAISVNSDTTIREALRIMKEHNVGSVLINSYSPPHQLEGIFTERDLLKWVADIEKNSAWDKSIATIMTKKMVTLNVLEIDRASEVMIKHNFRHVPIVYDSEDGRQHVAGVISMRDLFKGFVAERKQKAILDQFSSRRVLVLARERSEKELQRKLLESHVNLVFHEQDFEVSGLDPSLVVPDVLSSDLFVIDLDHFPADGWVKVLKMVLGEKKRPPVFVVYDPLMQDSRNVLALKQLSQGSVIHVFPKPINLLEYLRQMEKSL
ncbi:MAG: CBS domain-containing protein [Bdellovibrionales bacterium]|nr:CBS domain-containing protein [Bdellovibrionales bacterium]